MVVTVPPVITTTRPVSRRFAVRLGPAALPAWASRRHRIAANYLTPIAVYGAIVAARLAALHDHLPQHRGLRAALTSWDGKAFLDVAEHGYPHHVRWGYGSALVGSRAVFHPLYPALIRAVHLLPGLPWDLAGIAAAMVAATCAAVLLYRLGAALHSPAAGGALLILVMGQPLGVVFDMAYSEGLFLAFAVATLLAIRAGRWLAAGTLCFAAGLTRPTGLAVAAALAVTAAITLYRHPHTAGRWRPVAAVLVGAVGVPAWWLYVGLRLHRLDAWFRIQDMAWSTRYDGGRATARAVHGLLRHPHTWTDLGLLLILGLAIALTAVAVSERTWPPLLVYGTAVVALALDTDGIVGVKARYLTVAVAALWPAAVAVSKARRGTAALLLGAYLAVSVWYGTHVLAVGGLTI
jgi:hypothetical protein